MANYYFVDTRENAKSKEPFAIQNQDVAKSWTRDYNMGEGPFKPVAEPISEEGAGVVDGEANFHPEFQVNRRDLQVAGVNETPVQIEATQHNLKVVDVEGENPYKEMTKAELKDEMDARGIEYKTSGPEATNESYQKLLLADDDSE